MLHLRTTIIIAASLTLAACVNLGGGKGPPFLLSLSADAAPRSGETRTNATSAALTVLQPSAPQKLRTPRIPVQQDDASVAYVVGAQWVEAPQRLFHRLLADTLAAKTGRLVLDESQMLAAPGDQLAGQLLEFGVDARSNQAVVVFQAMLVSKDGKTIRQQRFEARQSTGIIEPRAVGAALNTAANKIAVDVAKWVEE